MRFLLIFAFAFYSAADLCYAEDLLMHSTQTVDVKTNELVPEFDLDCQCDSQNTENPKKNSDPHSADDNCHSCHACLYVLTETQNSAFEFIELVSSYNYSSEPHPFYDELLRPPIL